MKYSSLAYGVAVGMCVVAGLGALVTIAGGEPNPEPLAYIFAFFVALVPSVELVVDMRRLQRSDRLTERDRELKQQEVAARLAALAPKPAPVPPPPPDYTPGWRVALHRFCTAGEKYGFDVRTLAEGPHRVVAWDDWALLVGVLREAGILVGGPGRKTRWGAGWSFTRWEQERATLPLPNPPHTAPEVDLTVQHATQQRANNAPTVVEGEPSRPG